MHQFVEKLHCSRSLTGLYSLLAVCLILLSGCQQSDNEPIKVGILHSLTGTMAISEQPVVDATLLAIEEINAKGGLLGRKVVPIVVDGKSDWPTFASEAERLIREEKVAVLFGCWTSASRKAVKPIVEKYRHLLFYPMQYEGVEQSPHIVYGGLTANQQLMPAIQWSMENLGRRYLLVGSDYIFPHIANLIARDMLRATGGEVAGEYYLPLGSSEVDSIIEAIRSEKPDVILNTINGDTNLAFFRALQEAGITAEEVPVMSFSISEVEIQQMGGSAAGHYAVWSYFQSLENDENSSLLKAFRKKFGAARVVNDPMITAHANVNMWADSVRRSGFPDPASVLVELSHRHHNTAAGLVHFERDNNHMWKPVRIGKAKSDGQFDIIQESKHNLEPVPFPLYHTEQYWHGAVQHHYEQWAGHWQNPGTERLEAARARAHRLLEAIAQRIQQDTFIDAALQQLNRSDKPEADRIDAIWPLLGNEHPLIQRMLVNPAASELLSIQQQLPHIAEIFLTDIEGGIVAMSSKTSDYYQADESWWLKTWHDGTGRKLLSDIEFDESANEWSISVSLPLRGSDGSSIGIIKAGIAISDIFTAQGKSP